MAAATRAARGRYDAQTLQKRIRTSLMGELYNAISILDFGFGILDFVFDLGPAKILLFRWGPDDWQTHPSIRTHSQIQSLFTTMINDLVDDRFRRHGHSRYSVFGPS